MVAASIGRIHVFLCFIFVKNEERDTFKICANECILEVFTSYFGEGDM